MRHKGSPRLGLVYLHNETFAPKAVAYLDRAIALNSTNARYYNLRAVGLSRMNELERAADWEKVSALAPDDPEPHVQRGVDCLRRGDVHDAIRSLESALAKNPDHARAHGYLGVAWERQEDLERAFEHYDRAVALARDDAEGYCDRSYAYFRRGDYAKAIKDAERGVRLQAHGESPTPRLDRPCRCWGDATRPWIVFRRRLTVVSSRPCTKTCFGRWNHCTPTIARRPLERSR